MDSEEVWMITEELRILVMCASLMELVLFFLIKEAHFYPCPLQLTSRCASRGLGEPPDEQHRQPLHAWYKDRAAGRRGVARLDVG